jgi:HSF-type DNA-binding
MNIESRKVSNEKISYLDHLMVLHETTRNPPFQRVYIPVKRRHGGITQTFPIKLHTMLDEIEQKGLHCEIIRWSMKGDSFIIFKPIEFAKVLLPIYFRTKKLSSFQRQLNGYGFSKFNLQASIEDIQIYYHPDFHRDRADLLKLVTRRSVFDRDFVESLKNQQGKLALTQFSRLDIIDILYSPFPGSMLLRNTPL